MADAEDRHDTSGTGFPKRSCSNKKIERDDDSKKSHHALALLWQIIAIAGRNWIPESDFQ
jgi:hypothetical protein